MGANQRLDSLDDVVHQRANLRVSCKCGHVSVVDAAKLNRWYKLHCWGAQLEGQVAKHLRCTRCGGRPFHFKATFEPVSAPSRFPKNEDGWRQIWKRLRD